MPKVFAPEVVEEFFDLLCSGWSFSAAEEAVGVARGTGTAWWRKSGLMDLTILMGARGGLPGSPPVADRAADRAGASDPDGGSDPPVRRRALTSEDRAVIAVQLRLKSSYATIGRLIGRDVSVISREVKRNRGPDGSYWGPVAHRAAHERRRRPKPFKLVADPELCRRIEAWMDAGWSPGLIAAVLRRDHPGRSPAARMARVSHETIYQALYVQTRGQLRTDLYRQLNLKRPARRSRGGSHRGGSHTFDEAFTIRHRPPEVDDRAVPGHWEGDLILGPSGRSAIGTLVERSTRFTILLHLPGRHDAASVAEAMIREMGQLPEHLRRSITWDRGSELADYARIQVELQAPVFFCDPHSPWQRGTGENTNRLLRHWFTKGSDLSVHTAADLRRVAATLNARPRPTLGLQTPAQKLNELLHQAAA